MAIPFLNNITLNNNEIQNVRLQNAGSPPLNSGPGQIYFDSTGADETAKYYSNVTDTFVSLKEYTFPAGSFITGTVTGTTPKPIITFDLSAAGTPDATVYLRGDNAWAPISGIPGTYTWTVSDGSNSTPVASGETVTFSGTTNEIEVAESGRTVTIGLPDDVTITNNLTVGGTGDFTGQVTIPILPVASTDAASKDYVDNAVVGGLIYQGGYDATLNSPDLTTSPNSILKGWTYTVTVGGTFFGEVLEVGDVLIAEQDDPSSLADWTTVQNNIGIATDGTDAGAGAAIIGISRYDEDDFTVSATGFVQLNATSFVGQVSGTATPAPIVHNLGTKDVIVQLYDKVTFETVYADVERNDDDEVTITFAAIPTNSIRVLVQKIG